MGTWQQWTTLIFVLFLMLPVFFIAHASYEPGSGFLKTIHFGSKFTSRQLPEVQEIAPPAGSVAGYDGQFHAQIAIDPSLQDPFMRISLDAFFWRAKRIGLSAIAFVVGLGQPEWILHAYSVLNVLFWIGLLFLLHNRFDLRLTKTRLMAFAILWSTGVLMSIERALIDLPALLFSLLPVLLESGWVLGSFTMAYALLTKETAALSAPAILFAHRSPSSRLVYSALIMAGIPLLWYLYILQIGPGPKDSAETISIIPLIALGHKFYDAQMNLLNVTFRGLPEAKVLNEAIFEILAPASIFIQAVYCYLRYRLSDKFWWFGIGFAVLVLFLGNDIWEEQIGYTRIILPLTVAFNLLLFQYEQGRAYTIWWLLGNLGMFGLFIELIIEL